MNSYALGIVAWVVFLAVAAVVYLSADTGSLERLADATPSEAERIREELEHHVLRAELDAWLDEVTGQ